MSVYYKYYNLPAFTTKLSNQLKLRNQKKINLYKDVCYKCSR